MKRLAAALLTFCVATAAASPVQFEHKGVLFVGKDPPADATYDIPITPAAEGIRRVKEAMDILIDKSPFTAKAIERLGAKGRVVLIYDPAFPARDWASLTIAAFFPDFYAEGKSGKDFVTVVGRFGGRWSARDLAPVIAHELTGHGMQHFRGRLEHVREIDLECEAYLYQEKAYQDLGFDKVGDRMVAFRKTLEGKWCHEFRSWLGKERPKRLALWQRLNPDVPGILEDYLDYIEALRKSGVAGRAIELSKSIRQKQLAANAERLAESGDPNDQFQLALLHLQNTLPDASPETAVEWLTKAAEAGHPQAQFVLARAYWDGNGAAKDKAKAALWAGKAARQGIAPAQYLFGALLVNGDGVPRDRGAGVEWLKKAAKAGVKPAADALAKLGEAQ